MNDAAFLRLDRVPESIREGQLRWIMHEAKRGTHTIGFVPEAGLRRAAMLGRVGTMLRNNDLVAFAVWGGRGNSLRVYQLWVRADARLFENGRYFTDELARVAERSGKYRLRCWCLAGIEASLFWPRCGFELRGSRVRSVRRSRTQHLWVKELTGQTLWPVREAGALQVAPAQNNPGDRSPFSGEAPPPAPPRPLTHGAPR